MLPDVRAFDGAADAVRAVGALVRPRAEAKALPLRLEIDPAARPSETSTEAVA